MAMAADNAHSGLLRSQLAALRQGLQSGLVGPKWQAAASSLLALSILLPIWWFALRAYEGRVLLEQRGHAIKDLSPKAHALAEDFQDRFAVLEGIRAFLSLDALHEPNDFELGLPYDGLPIHMKGVRSLWIAPGGVVQRVYPQQGNEALLGRDFLQGANSPVLRAHAQLAIDSGKVVLCRPDELGLGSSEWLAWLAIYRRGAFWGLLAARLDPIEMIGTEDLHTAQGWLRVALRDDTGRILYGQPDVFAADPVIHTIEIGETSWELAAVPEDGWLYAVRDQFLVLQAAGLVIVALLVGLVYLSASRQARLTFAVKERTLEISRINRALQDDIAKRKHAEAERERLLEQLEERVAQRTHHLQTLYDVTAVASASLDLREILERSLDRIVASLESDAGSILLHDQAAGQLRMAASRNFPLSPADQQSAETGACGLCRWAYDNNEPLVVADIAADPRTARAFSGLGPLAHVGVPIRGKNRPAGVLCLFRSAQRPFSLEEVVLLRAIGEQLGVAVENAWLYAAAQDKAALEERQRLAGALHDSVTQLIYSVTLLAEASRQLVKAGKSATATQYLGRLGETAQQALKEMRLLLYELRTAGLPEEGLVTSLQRRLDAVEKRAGLSAQLYVEGEIDLPTATAEILNRIAQEALNNALKHAAATSVQVSLRVDGDELELVVLDDGRGFDPANIDHGGLGLAMMRERAAKVRGALSVASSPGAGTIVRVRVPHRAQENPADHDTALVVGGV